MQPLDLNIRQRGFFTIAQNSPTCDYVRLAYALALSLKCSQHSIPYLSIGITPGTIVPPEYAWAFDNIIEIPWGDHAANSEWKLENEWKSIYMSPYDETIKLDCDMLFFNDISLWWDTLATQDFAICNRILNYRAQDVDSDYYRKTFTANALPDVYTAFMYFKKTPSTFAIFDMAKFIYFNWESMFEVTLDPMTRPIFPSTDVIFAIALKLLDLDSVSYTKKQLPTFTHMKSHIQGWGPGDILEDWTKHMNVFFNPGLECKIGNYLQFFPLHYHVKDFVTDEMIGYYERAVRK